MIRILVVDDHDMFRQSLVALVADQPDIEICGQAADGFQAVQMASEALPDVILMDIAMPGLDGIAATRQILQDALPCRVVMLTSHAGLSRMQEVADAGAQACLVKGCPPDEIFAAVRSVSHGGQVFPGSLGGRLFPGLPLMS
jgi:DNA-binding NarL/FixJ family response regulator